MGKAPDSIWLAEDRVGVQIHEEGPWVESSPKSGVAYVRADLHDAALARIVELEEVWRDERQVA